MTYHRLNQFKINNLNQISYRYRLFEITGLPSGDNFEKNTNLLAKNLAFELKAPVTSINRGDHHYVALSAEASPNLEQPLTPHVATLRPHNEAEELDFGHLSIDTMPIALSFLRYAFRGPLMQHSQLWETGRAYFPKIPLNHMEQHREVDIFKGFHHTIVSAGPSQVFLMVDLTHKYVDTMFLLQRADGEKLKDYRMRHCLYQFGHRWYRVQLLNTTGSTIGEQKFKDPRTGEVHNIYDYTISQCGKPRPDYIRTLDAGSPAILYRYPGNEETRYGAAALCRLIYATSDPYVRGIHSYSINEPNHRFDEIERIVHEYFGNVYLGDTHVQVIPETIAVPKRYFQVPDQRFGNDTVVHVKQYREGNGIDIGQLGATRMQNLVSPNVGPFGASEFHIQYMFIPQSLHRSVGKHFQEEFSKAVQQFSPYRYQVKPILYDDRNARNLTQQVRAFEQAIQENDCRRGYALLILPANAAKDLHNYLKRSFWPDLQFQCATANKIVSFYHFVQETYEFKRELQSKFVSYLRYMACGLLNVNRMWPWVLESSLHYEVYVGIDVLNSRAGFTFVFDGARHTFFEDFPSRQKEKLTSKQIETVLYNRLSEHLRDLDLHPRSIVVHRDGRLFDSERTGIQRAVKRLKSEGFLDNDAVIGVVDIRKTSSSRLRIVEERKDGSLMNPRIGAYYVPQENGREGFVCNTGWPFKLPGTVNPLHACIVEGDLDIRWVLEDIFALSQLIWAAPDRCARLPLTIKLADDFLDPIAAEVNEEEALYGDEDELDSDSNEEA